MSFCGAVQCATLLLGAVQNSPLKLPIGIPLGGYGSIHRRDLVGTFLPFKRFSRYFKASVGQDQGGVRTGAFLLRKDKKTIVLVSLETVAVTSQLRSAIFVNLQQIPGLDLQDDGFFLTATHTHSGPGGLSNSLVWELAVMDQFLPEVWDQTLANVTHDVATAFKKLEPVRLRFGQVSSAGLSKNRMDQTKHPANLGHGVLMSNAKDGQVVGGLVTFPVHGTGFGPSNLLLSGDVPGAIVRETEKLFKGSHFLFMSEEAADMAPSQSKHDGILSLATQFALDFRAHSVNFKETKPKIDTKAHNFFLGIPKIKLSQCAAIKFLPEGLSPSLNLDKLLPVFASVGELNIGDLRFMFWPGELSSGVGFAIRNSFEAKKLKPPINLTLANDYQGYFLTPEEHELGGYEACASFYGPDSGTKLAAGVLLK